MLGRMFGATLVAASVLVTTMPAMASGFELSAKKPSWSLAFRLGPYRPRIADKGSDQRKFFNKAFNRGLKGALFARKPMLKELEVDYYLLTSLGYAGLAFAIGQWKVDGKARICNGGKTSCTSAQAIDAQVSQPGNTNISLVVMPLTLSAIYRADFLMRSFYIPLMPYVRGGLAYHFWWTRTNGATATAQNGVDTMSGKGGSWGLTGSAGIALNLDWMDPTAKTGEQSSIGLIGTYLFGEITFISADGFGSNKHLDLSAVTMLMGLKVDFDH